jgi:tRNA 2-thiouridine synthesizing protein A
LVGVADSEIEVDARGLFCPLPVLRLARALRDAPAGAVAHLLSTDPVSVQDVEVFCRDLAHTLLESRREGDVFAFRIRK